MVSERISFTHLGGVAAAAAVGLLGLVANYQANIRAAAGDDFGLVLAYYLPIFGLFVSVAATAALAATWRKRGGPADAQPGFTDRPWVVALASLVGGSAVGAAVIVNFGTNVAGGAPGGLPRLAGYFGPTVAALAAQAVVTLLALTARRRAFPRTSPEAPASTGGAEPRPSP